MLRLKKKETTATTTIAPIIDGIMAIPAIFGPQLPKIASPMDEPTKPAIILLIQPIAAPRLVMAPAIAPITAPTIKTHNQCIKFTFPFFEQTFYNDYKDKYTLIKGVMQGNHTIKAVEQIHNISCACYLFHKCFNNKIGM